VRHQRRGLVEVVAAGAREGMVDARIDVHLRAGPAREAPRARCGARLGRAELVELGDMQQQSGTRMFFGFLERALDAHAVVAHRHVGIGAAGREVGQLAAEAEAQHAGLAAAGSGRCAQRLRRSRPRPSMPLASSKPP
jgi:hypothetical protein